MLQYWLGTAETLNVKKIYLHLDYQILVSSVYDLDRPMTVNFSTDLKKNISKNETGVSGSPITLSVFSRDSEI